MTATAVGLGAGGPGASPSPRLHRPGEAVGGGENILAWLGQNRRMSKHYERLPESSEAFVYVAMTRLMARRLTRK